MLEEIYLSFANSNDFITHSVYNIAMLLGTIQAIIFASEAIRFVYKHTLRTKGNLISRYGEGSWAVVTGASDGIGAEYCKLLAEDGFNIVLISRTMSKLEKVEQECKKINNKIQTKIVQADFADNATDEFYKGIYNQLKDLDISILINNAGIMHTSSFATPGREVQWKHTIDVNVVQVAMMTSYFVPKLLKRAEVTKKKCGLINVSSTMGHMDACAGAAVYCASKGYVNYFTLAIAHELRGKLDIQCNCPSLTSTNLLKEKSRKHLMAISPRDSAYGSLRDLGKDIITSGPLFHDIQMPLLLRFLTKIPPVQWIFYYIFKNRLNN